MDTKITVSYCRIERSGAAWGPVSSSKTGIHRLTEQTEWAHCLNRAAIRPVWSCQETGAYTGGREGYLGETLYYTQNRNSPANRANRVGSLPQ